jgi:DNA-binding NtrC family response regulator
LTIAIWNGRRSDLPVLAQTRSEPWQKARGGTPFLQEIADLSIPMQQRIAEVLRDPQPRRAPWAAGHRNDGRVSLGDGDGDD